MFSIAFSTGDFPDAGRLEVKMKFVMKILMLSLMAALGAVCVSAAPLLSPGKQSVYQRAVTHPGAKLYSGPESGASVITDPVKTFTVMYIYGREGDRVQVGSGSDSPDGWMDKAMLTEWPQAITMLFTDRTSGRDPVLFFRDHKSIEDVCLIDDLEGTLEKYQDAIKSGNVPPDYPVIAMEPAETAVSEKNFYLLPVLSIDDQFYQQQGPRLIEVASINPGLSEEEGSASANARGGKESDYKTGIAVVIDTTISMKPYIDETKKLIRTLYDELEKSPNADKVAFAVVAFRNNMDRAPGIEYTTKVISDFTTVKNRRELENALDKLEEATVSTHDVNEDSFAGIKEAVDSLSWDKFGSRVMMMVSDAGPLQAGDETSATGLGPEALADYLRRNNIYLTAVHVKNPKSAKNHAYAEQAYTTLTMQSNNEASYLPVTNAKSFESVAKELATSYREVGDATAEGKMLPKPEATSGRKLTPEEKARRIAETTGYAMQLQFFGNKAGSTAPQVVNAWIADADLEKLAANLKGAPVLAVEPAVLLTKGQLSNLYKQLKLLLAGSETAFLNGDADLFGQIASAAAQMSRDPQQFSLHPDRNLMENGLLDEVLADLPYKSVIGSMSREDWESMSTGQRDSFIRRIKSLLALYESYDRDAAQWESFGAKNPNDRVFRVPLNALP